MPSRKMKLKGRGKFKEFLGKANNFLKKSQILSKLGNAYSKYGGMAGLPYAQHVGMARTPLNRRAMDDEEKDELDQV